jgi:hypothetical protein
MKLYQHPSEARTFYAPDAEPSLDLGVPVAARQRPGQLPSRPNQGLGTPCGSGTAAPRRAAPVRDGAYLGVDFRAAYAPGVALNGAGQSVALVEFDTYFTNDILAYEKLDGIAPVAITNVLVDGFTGRPDRAK